MDTTHPLTYQTHIALFALNFTKNVVCTFSGQKRLDAEYGTVSLDRTRQVPLGA